MKPARTAIPLSRRFLNVIFISVVVNLLLSLGLVGAAGTFKRLEVELYEDFASQVSREAGSLNQLLDSYATNVIIMANNVDNRIKALAERYGITTSDIRLSPSAAAVALDFALSSLLIDFDTHGAMGSYYFILQNPMTDEGETQQGIYLDTIASVDLPLIYVRGPRNLAERANIPLAETWQTSVRIPMESEGRGNFFRSLSTRIYDHSTTIREDGHWARPYDMLGDGRSSISYTVPLIDGDDKKAYAILGIAIDTSLLIQRLEALRGGKFGMKYYISRSDANELSPSWIITGNKLLGMDGDDILDGKPARRVDLPNNTGKIVEFDAFENGTRVKHLSFLHKLDMHGNIALQPQDGWALIGFAEKSVVLRQYYKMIALIATSLLVAMLGSGILIYALAKRYFDKISGLSRMISIDTMKSPQHQDRTNIGEIDSLADAIEDMSRSASESTLRVATILDLLEMPIGGYEVRTKGIPRVFVTPSVKSMLALKDTDDSMYMDLEEWRKVYDKLKSAPYDYDENIYRWHPEEDTNGVKYFSVEEMTREDATIGVLIDVTAQVLKSMDLEYLASFDSLTKLYNRTSFKRKAMAEIRHATDKTGVMIFGDLDGLKRINDICGHAKGDLLIQTAAATMATLESLGGIVARLSGDEFAAYVHGFGSRDEAIDVVLQHMAKNFNRSVTLTDGISIPISISRGLAVYPDDSDDFSTLLSLADYTMYQAKYARKGSVRIFDKGSYFNDETLRHKSDTLTRVIEERSMSYAYQPLYDVKAKKLAGYSVYLRPPSETLCDARNTLDIATISGNQGRLEKMIFEDVLAWIEKEKPDQNLMICVKTIKNYIFDQEEFEELCARYVGNLPQLMVMIPTGTALDEGINRQKIRMFRECGAKIALDGLGDDLEESLDMLKLRPDMVKIDIRHIRNASSYRESRLKLDNIIMKCRQKDILMLAMQIETKSDYETAIGFGFDIVQGYYIGYPQNTLSAPSLLE